MKQGKPKMMAKKMPAMKKPMKKTARDNEPGKGRKGMMKRLAGAEL